MTLFDKLNTATKPIALGLQLILAPGQSEAQAFKQCNEFDFSEPCFSLNRILATIKSYENPQSPLYGAFNIETSAGDVSPPTSDLLKELFKKSRLNFGTKYDYEIKFLGKDKEDIPWYRIERAK